jgi:4-hydroxy-tetrahydrodipicolinate reductase
MGVIRIVDEGMSGMTNAVKLGVNGAAGRMGQRVIALATQDKSLRLVGAYESSTSPKLGQDAGELAGVGRLGVPVHASIDHSVDVIIDFSTPEGCLHILTLCEERRIPLVIATTGLTAQQKASVASAAQTTPILMAPSMSLAVNIAMKLVGEAGRALRNHSSGVDVEIIERHHRYKEDAPSGTALKFGEIVAKEMGQTNHIHGREGRTGQRPQSEIGYHALRVGDNVGEHTIVFGLLGETLEIAVRGQSRDSYAMGALTAAKFLVTKSAGLYSMNDALGL